MPVLAYVGGCADRSQSDNIAASPNFVPPLEPGFLQFFGPYHAALSELLDVISLRGLYC